MLKNLSALVKDNKLQTIASPTILGVADPAPGYTKTITISYTYDNNKTIKDFSTSDFGQIYIDN